jgi:hypothetical protein
VIRGVIVALLTAASFIALRGDCMEERNAVAIVAAEDEADELPGAICVADEGPGEVQV